MPFGFDPRKLVKEKEEQEKENENNVIWETIAKDIDAEEKEKALRKKSTIQEALDMAEQAIRESKYMEKHGWNVWYKKKKEIDGVIL